MDVFEKREKIGRSLSSALVLTGAGCHGEFGMRERGGGKVREQQEDRQVGGEGDRV